jgi:glycosyltransferase involved in cell wall biosynthesis
MDDDIIELARPEDMSARPSVSLHLLVKNGESVVGRLVDCVGPYVAEVVAVLNDTTDRTADVIRCKGTQYDLRVGVVEVTRETHPELYLLDVPATYEVGRPLVGERYEGPFTAKPILSDWSAARNLGWEDSTCRWRLFLDADDVLDDPHCIPGLCQLLEARGLDVVASRYHYDRAPGGQSRGDAFRERLARNDPKIVWQGVVHECLAGYDRARVAHVEGTLVARDLRDSRGSEVRIPGRNLKVLYHRARSCGWQLTPRELVYLAAESRVCMPRLAARLIEMYLDVSTWDEERAWAASMMGEICENEQDFALASSWYERSLREHPGVLAAFRLARSRFRQGLWSEAVLAYEVGIRNKSVPQHLDGGDVYEDATKIFVATCLHELGKHAEAAEMCRQAREKFPQSAALSELEQQVGTRRGS